MQSTPPIKSIPVLKSKENPDGWKLEELLDQLTIELREKNRRLYADAQSYRQAKNPTQQQLVAWLLYQNNGTIADILIAAAAIQRNSLHMLNTVGPDQGPTGTPRVGPGREMLGSPEVPPKWSGTETYFDGQTIRDNKTKKPVRPKGLLDD